MPLFDPEFIKYLISLGVGGILAAFIFSIYRKDIKQYTDLWKNNTDVLMGVVKDNTASNTKLIALIEVQERNMIRKADIENLIDKHLKEQKS